MKTSHIVVVVVGPQLLEDKGVKDTAVTTIPMKLFHPYRILILKILAAHGEAEFRELKHDLQLTDGNLATHLRVLEELGYIKSKKDIVDKKVRTSYAITQEGLKAFRNFATSIREVTSSVEG
jgi:DNA-binding MarR family transcriptional regulator